MDVADDLTLDELRAALAPALPAEAAFDGWRDAALVAAAAAVGADADRARLAIPGGPVDMIDLWFAHVDRLMAEQLPPDRLRAMRMRDRIAALVTVRLEAVAPYREALRRALSILAMPQHAAAGARLGWRAADHMWRLAGDTATGFPHYSKRLSLLGVYGSTLLALLGDESEALADTHAFLARRIDDVMRIEILKAQLRPDRDRRFSVTRFLGRMRYPVA